MCVNLRDMSGYGMILYDMGRYGMVWYVARTGPRTLVAISPTMGQLVLVSLHCVLTCYPLYRCVYDFRGKLLGICVE